MMGNLSIQSLMILSLVGPVAAYAAAAAEQPPKQSAAASDDDFVDLIAPDTSEETPAEAAAAAPPAGSGEVAPDSTTPSGTDDLGTIGIASVGKAGAAAPKRPAVTSRLIEEIVVTAQKREENLQDVPISVSAFSADQLDARGIVDPKDLPLATPGLTLAAQAGFTITYLRGVGTDAFLLADPSVALYIDGVYFPFSGGQAQNLGAVERVEVLKGPQGTLFGRNAVGGAINVVTKSPDFADPSGSLQASYASYDNAQARLHVNIPLGDSFAFSMSAVYGSEDDYRDGTTAGQPLPGEVTRGARVKLRWMPTEALDMTLAAYRLEQQGVGTLFAPNTDPSPIVGGGISPQSADSGDVDTHAFSEFDDQVIYGHVTLNTDWFDIKLLGSDQSVTQVPQFDFDGSPQPLVSFASTFLGEIRTAELQLISNDESWASDDLKWIFGYYYFDGFQGIDEDRFAIGGTLLGGVNALLGPVLQPLGIPPLVSGDVIQADGFLQNDSNSLYAQGTYTFSDWAALTLGLRAQEEKRTIIRSSGSFVAQGSGEPVPYVDYRGQSDTTRSLTPKLSLEFHPWEEGLLYLSYQQAVKSSTFNVVNFARFTEPEPVKKEELAAYEVGLKTSLLEGTTTLSAAAFYYDIRNIQVQFVSLFSGGAVTFENAPRAEVKGIEFDLLSQVFPSLIDGLVLSLSGAYVDARFTDYAQGQGFDPETRMYTDSMDLTGERIPRTPRFSGTVGLSQTLMAPGGSVELGGEYYYNSGYYYLAQSDPFDEEKAYGLLGARISYLYEPWQLRTTLFGKNILDQTYNNSRFVTDFGTLDAQAPGAVYGLRLNWEF